MLRRLSLSLILLANAGVADELELVSRLRLTSDHPHFGGLSGIEIVDEGRRAYLLSDRGRLFETFLTRQNGQLSAVQPKVSFLSWFGGDSEGLAFDGVTNFVSYEWVVRVGQPWRQCFPSHPDFADLHGNQALEALAVADNGTFYALPEKRLNKEKGFPIYRSRFGGWDIASYLEPSGKFKPVGADFGPDGLLYVLERRLGIWGFQSQVRRLNPDQETAAEILWTSDPADFDNLEGMSVWVDDAGQTRLTMVADDNFERFLRGELVEFVLKEQLAKNVADG